MPRMQDESLHGSCTDELLTRQCLGHRALGTMLARSQHSESPRPRRLALLRQPVGTRNRCEERRGPEGL